MFLLTAGFGSKLNQVLVLVPAGHIFLTHRGFHASAAFCYTGLGLQRLDRLP